MAGTQAFQSRIENVVVEEGDSSTRWIIGNLEYADATQIYIQAPSFLDAGTWTIETSVDGATPADLYLNGNAVTAPAAGTAETYTVMIGAPYWRIASSGAAAADRAFLVSKQYTA